MPAGLFREWSADRFRQSKSVPNFCTRFLSGLAISNDVWASPAKSCAKVVSQRFISRLGIP